VKNRIARDASIEKRKHTIKGAAVHRSIFFLSVFFLFGHCESLENMVAAHISAGYSAHSAQLEITTDKAGRRRRFRLPPSATPKTLMLSADDELSKPEQARYIAYVWAAMKAGHVRRIDLYLHGTNARIERAVCTMLRVVRTVAHVNFTHGTDALAQAVYDNDMSMDDPYHQCEKGDACFYCAVLSSYKKHCRHLVFRWRTKDTGPFKRFPQVHHHRRLSVTGYPLPALEKLLVGEDDPLIVNRITCAATPSISMLHFVRIADTDLSASLPDVVRMLVPIPHLKRLELWNCGLTSGPRDADSAKKSKINDP
jgi:hypothetical protein